MLPPPPTSALFPYTTLFRSRILATDFPQQNEGYGIHVTPLREAITGGPEAATMLAIIFAAVGLVLLIACVNVANLRSEEHTSELQSRRDVVCRLLLGKKKEA